jgi:RNA polymerase sigma factor (sigma-70 family)
MNKNLSPDSMNKQTDKEHIGKLIEVYRPRLRAFIRKRVSNPEDADDILQDVCYRFVKAAEDSLHPIEQAAAWLYRVARNAIINKGKKKTEEAFSLRRDGSSLLDDIPEVLFGGTSSTPETDYMRSLVWTELEAALSALPPEQREIFELTELDGIPVREISQATGIPLNTLLSRKHYAVKHLRKRLEELYRDFLSC